MLSNLAAIDLTAIETGMGEVKTAVLASGAVVIAFGLALFAVKFGGKYVIGLFKSFSK